MANEINSRYYPQRLTSVVPLDCYDLLEKLGLDIEWKYISPSLDIQGMYFVEDGEFYVWPHGEIRSGDKPILEKFKKDTIVINQILLDKKSYKQKENFVCTHEIGHAIKDKEYFRLHPKNRMQMCSEASLRGSSWNDSMQVEDVIESQNNYLTAALLMPREVIKTQFFKALKWRNIPSEPVEFVPYMKKSIGVLAKGYGVNYNPVIYRLCDIGVLDRDSIPNNYNNNRR